MFFLNFGSDLCLPIPRPKLRVLLVWPPGASKSSNASRKWLGIPPPTPKTLCFTCFCLSVVGASIHFLEFWSLLVWPSQVSFECLEDLATFPWSRGGSNLVPTPKPRILREFASQGLLGRPNPRGIPKSHSNASRKWQGRVKSPVF